MTPEEEGAESGSAVTTAEPFPVPWSPWTAVAVFALQFFAVTVLGVLLAAVVGSGAVGETFQRAALVLASSLAAAGFTLFVVYRRFPGETWRLRGPQRPTWRAVLTGLGYGLGSYFVVGFGLASLLQALATAGGAELPEVQTTFREFAADPAIVPFFLFGAIVLAPIGEELLFRGMLFQALRSRVGVWPGIGLSAIAFAVVHWDPTTTLGGNLLVVTTIFALGMLLAWMFHRTGTLVVPVVAHAIFNAISAVLLVATS